MKACFHDHVTEVVLIGCTRVFEIPVGVNSRRRATKNGTQLCERCWSHVSCTPPSGPVFRRNAESKIKSANTGPFSVYTWWVAMILAFCEDIVSFMTV